MDTMRYLFGEIERVTCVTDRVNPIIAGEDLVVAVLGLASGGHVVYDADRSAYANPVRSLVYGTMSVEGEEGTSSSTATAASASTGATAPAERSCIRFPKDGREDVL